MKQLLHKLTALKAVLTKEEAKQTLIRISKGEYNASQVVAFLTVYMMRNITVEELSGFREALLELCIATDFSSYNAIDLCGTGGDGKDTFNVSTLSSFVAAGAGIKVTKHGNYGVSSKCGSSNVLESLGIVFSNDKDYLTRCLETAGICILHAPLFHPAMKYVAPFRKELAVKTFFNMLGPMVNPAFPSHQMVGVFNLELARKYSYIYQNTDKNYSILHALDGYDEISLTSATKVISNHSEQLLEAKDFGVQPLTKEAIRGGDTIKASADIFLNVLHGKGTTAQNHIVCANAGMAIATVENLSPKAGFEKAKESLESKKALAAFTKLQKLGQNNN